MRLALILAFISSVFFHSDPAEARPGAETSAQARKPSKAQKRRAARSATKAKAKAKAKPRKRDKATRQAKRKADPIEVEDKEEVEVDADEAPKVEARPQVKRAPVAQATDDEVPANEPKPRNKR